jgi:nicotinate-nucleotide adenylyltransferase
MKINRLHNIRHTVGLLGGSFNPAHAGHRYISEYAISKLDVSSVWWLVSPRNPLKLRHELADYHQRLASAQAAATHPAIHVSDIEARLQLRYSYQTIRALQKRFPRIRFVWLMGADNLASFHRWRHWQWIARHIPLLVFDRAPYSYSAMASPAANRLRAVRQHNPRLLAKNPAPGLSFVRLRRHPLSATQLRKTLGPAAFLGHNE